MGNAKRLTLVALGLGFLLGLGLYLRHQHEVHDWLRTTGRPKLQPGEALVGQRETKTIPMADGSVSIRIGDIRRGKSADIEILDSDSVVLSSQREVQVRDRLTFEHMGKKFVLEVVRYTDHVGTIDTALIRIVPDQAP